MATFACNPLANAQKWKDQIFSGEDTVNLIFIKCTSQISGMWGLTRE